MPSMDYDMAKGLQALLFFGVALGFPLWQVIAIRGELRNSNPDRSDHTAKSEKGRT